MQIIGGSSPGKIVPKRERLQLGEGYRMEKRERARRSGAERTRLRRRRKQNKSSIICISLIVFTLIGVMSVQIVSVYQRNESYKTQETELQAQLETEQIRQGELKEYEKYVGTREYIEQVAKTRLGLVYSNEIIFKEKTAEDE